MAIGGTTRFKSRSPSGSATDCRAASVTPGRRIWGQWGHPPASGQPGSTTFLTTMPIQDPTLPPKSQKSYETIDQPQALNFYFNYEVPRFSFSQNGWRRLLLSGWTTDGIFHYQSGFPIQTPNSTSPLNSVTFANGANSGLISFGRIAFRASRSSCIVSTATTLTRALRSFSTPLHGQTRRQGPTPIPSRSTAIIVARDIPASSWASARSSPSRRA